MTAQEAREKSEETIKFIEGGQLERLMERIGNAVNHGYLSIDSRESLTPDTINKLSEMGYKTEKRNVTNPYLSYKGDLISW
ncbi:hypothetical protein [Dyadobacter sp. CY312]|uniref:hypothetical protein n=1 Tax=Dyadobacter sp. CY312 TaxID=2907303 RepID=UPI001F41C6D9|nr:hypothetical protein [Dyadobacter sp. CY312]MCE7039221.1 hypothetical protein [Dyadobacter sp. CY312]